MNRLVSVDFHADFGCLKKPDTNDPVYLTYNMLHRPAILGILGAIAGLSGFEKPPTRKVRKQKKQPQKELFDETPAVRIGEYYDELKDLKVGIRPLGSHQNGNFEKTLITYVNGVGYANLDGGTLPVTEQTLIEPSYRCYVLFDKDTEVYQTLYTHLRDRDAVYLPYLGKNEFSLWWDNWKEYEFEPFDPGAASYKISSVFLKEAPVKEGKSQVGGRAYVIGSPGQFMYFERLPVGYDLKMVQYKLADFAFTDASFRKEYPVSNLYKLKDTDEIVQLFS